MGDRTIEIQGDAGYIHLDDCWNYNSPVKLVQRINNVNGLRVEESIFEVSEDPNRFGYYNINQARGIAILYNAILDQPVLSCGNEYSVHITELTCTTSQGI